MMKHLSWFPWLMGALLLGILLCMGVIAYLLFFYEIPSVLHAGAQLVKEALHAAAV